MRSIDVMLSRPGIYVVLAAHLLAFVEVDETGRCWQLELTSGGYRRDGELRAGGWNTAGIRSIHGPFQRTASTARAEA